MSSLTDGRTPILFPIEIRSRELDYKLFLALLCLNRHNRMFIGQHDTLFRLSRHIRGGVYIGKNIFLLEWPMATLDRYASIKRHGFVYIHLDEEGAIYYGLEPQWREQLSRRVDPQCLAPDDYMCTWGDFQRDYYKSLGPDCAGHIVTTGYPKFDFYKAPYAGYYGDAASRLRDEHGPFILVNTNFGLVNHRLGTAGAFVKAYGYDVDSPEMRTRFLRTWAHDTAIYAGLMRVINRLSVEFPQHRIVVRPHPVENHARYEHIFGGVPNVRVVHEGEVAPWLLACEVLVHNGCTTAVEAHFLGTPIVNYNPVEDVEANLFLPNTVGTACPTEEAVVDQVRANLNGQGRQRDTGAVHPKAGALIFNFGSAEGVQRFVGVVADAERAARQRGTNFRWAGHALDEVRHRTWALAKDVARPLFPEKQKWHRFLSGAALFSGFSRRDVASRVSRMSRIVGRPVRLNFHARDLFSLESEG